LFVVAMIAGMLVKRWLLDPLFATRGNAEIA
jgi:hypothetical protein